MARTGRRPGASGTRAAILAAARRQFAEAGYGGATIRAIAAEAGVDPALVHHYHGTKRELFVAALDLPADPGPIAEAIAAAGPEGVGERLLRTALDVWDNEEARPRFVALLRSMVTDTAAARMLRDFLLENLLLPIARAVAPDRPEARATLVASQLIGFALVRFVVGIEPLASAPHDEVVAALAPTIQRYLTGAL